MLLNSRYCVWRFCTRARMCRPAVMPRNAFSCRIQNKTTDQQTRMKKKKNSQTALTEICESAHNSHASELTLFSTAGATDSGSLASCWITAGCCWLLAAAGCCLGQMLEKMSNKEVICGYLPVGNLLFCLCSFFSSFFFLYFYCARYTFTVEKVSRKSHCVTYSDRNQCITHDT